MTSWKTYRLGDICDLVAGFAFKSKDFGDYPNKVVKIADIQPPVVSTNDLVGVDMSNYDANKLCKYIVSKGDYVLAMTGATIGKLGRITNDIEAYINQRVLTFRPIESIVDKDFLYYQLCSDKFNKYILNHIDSETAQPNISAGSVGGFEISLPGLEGQRRIAGILGAIDDKIENNRRINDNLEQQAQALYKQWFVDFDFPNEDGKPYKSSGGKMVDSELGQIPEGWRVGVLKDFIKFQSGFAFKSDLFAEHGKYRLITIKGVQDGFLDINGAVYINDIPNKMPSYCLLNEGDIIMSLTGNVGRCCIVDRKNLLLNQRVVKLDPAIVDSNMYVYAMFRQEKLKEKLITLARGTAQANLSPIETANLHAILPDDTIVRRFGKYGEPIFSSILNNIKESITLATLRDTLLPKLMNGEIKL